MAVLAAIAYSAVGTLVLLKLVGLVIPLRADANDEGLGLDISQHGEEAYASGEGAILILPKGEAKASVPVVLAEAAGGRA